MIQKHLVLFAFIILFALFQLPFFYRVKYIQEIPWVEAGGEGGEIAYNYKIKCK